LGGVANEVALVGLQPLLLRLTAEGRGAERFDVNGALHCHEFDETAYAAAPPVMFWQWGHDLDLPVAIGDAGVSVPDHGQQVLVEIPWHVRQREVLHAGNTSR